MERELAPSVRKKNEALDIRRPLGGENLAANAGSFCYFFALNTFWEENESEGFDEATGFNAELLDFLQSSLLQSEGEEPPVSEGLDPAMVSAIIAPFLDAPFVDRELILNNWTRVVLLEVESESGRELFLIVWGTLPGNFRAPSPDLL